MAIQYRHNFPNIEITDKDNRHQLLLTCKNLVEGNAARLKGWGGLHDNVDMQLILFQECSRRLDAMTIHEVRSLVMKPMIN